MNALPRRETFANATAAPQEKAKPAFSQQQQQDQGCPKLRRIKEMQQQQQQPQM